MQDIMEAMARRHSVRSYTDEPLSAEERAALEAEVARCNQEGGLHIKLVCDEPQAFTSTMAHYGKFNGVRNYLVLAGPAADDLEQRCGYYGQRIALLAQQLGLGTCWVALTFKKRYVKKALQPGDKMPVVIALGHGASQGASRKSKTPDQVSAVDAAVATQAPGWFSKGVEAALLAPTAMNQQSFKFTLKTAQAGGKPRVEAVATGGMYSKVDLGIVKYHFELGAGTQNFTWA